MPASLLWAAVNPLLTHVLRTSSSDDSRPSATVSCAGRVDSRSAVRNSGRLSTRMRLHPPYSSNILSLTAAGISAGSKKLPDVYIFTNGSPLYLESARSTCLLRSSAVTPLMDAVR